MLKQGRLALDVHGDERRYVRAPRRAEDFLDKFKHVPPLNIF
jgi:hypothetical protein